MPCRQQDGRIYIVKMQWRKTSSPALLFGVLPRHLKY